MASSSFRIAIIDDDEDQLLMFSEMLADGIDFAKKVEISTFSDPQAALDYLETTKVDLIMTDVWMDKFKGPEIFRILRMSANANQSTPVILLSGQVNILQLDEILSNPDFNLGSFEVIKKPFEMSALLGKISNMVQ